MKNNDQSGFILMIVIMVAIAIMIIGFAIYRITEANSTEEAAVPQSISITEDESASV